MLEAGGIASHSMASVNSVFAANGHHMTVEEVLDNCTLGEDIHTAPTKLVCVENTLSGSELALPFPALPSLSLGPRSSKGPELIVWGCADK